jgi:hypothetical protein
MRALTRMRLLAAACALLLTFASTARATTSRPIDRPDGPPEPTPVQVGDPDNGHDLIVILFGGRVFMLRLPTIGPRIPSHFITRSTSRAPRTRGR